MEALKVIIVGGGLSGSLLANGLINNGVNTTVYERDSENLRREGYQIRLGPSTLEGFKACLTEAHMASIIEKFGQSTGSASTAPTLYTTKFKPILDLTQLPSYTTSSNINRVTLRDLLIDPVKRSGHVRFGKTFSNYEIETGNGGKQKVHIYFKDGSSDICDILIGADGNRSNINQQLGLRNIVQINSHWSFLAKGSLSYERIEKFPSQLLKGPILVFSKGATLYYALYLPSSNEENNEAPGKIPKFDVGKASFYWGLTIPNENFKYKDVSEIPDRRQFCLDFIKDWAPEFNELLSVGSDDKDSQEIYVTQLRASNKPSKNWRASLQRKKGHDVNEGHPRVWLIGDAVHAMQPHRGMGGNQAMHDTADILPHLLALNNIANSGDGPTTAQVQKECSQYESAMIDRAFNWVRKSGGASMPNLDFDGFLGTVIAIIGSFLLPVANFTYRLLKSSPSE